MIYTCTLNPAIDLYVGLDEMKANQVNRTYEEDYQPNGKGINVSIMLKRLGLHSTALGFLGGFTGRFIEEELQKMNISTDFIKVDGITRVNVFANAKEEYKIVNSGPDIPSKQVSEILEKIKIMPEGSMLFVSGSLPRNVDNSIFEEIANLCKTCGVNLVLDTSSTKVMETLKHEPYLLKPNEEELASFFQVLTEEVNQEKIIELSHELLDRGAQQVLVSRGEKGAMFVSKNQIVLADAPKGEVVNTACSGDALLSMFIGKQINGYSIQDSLRFASAAGAATAFSKGLGEMTFVEKLVPHINITHYKEGGQINV
ncbi:1-phosphofructokinase [Salibacterium salarium]|uniref:Tagatose-6-phosphate kinase n=1 Tax=Salibacterium salarium TaxID=284579 RepID=A0A428N497_9BACI|nr:1-phosphofructokinase [Salibacterium salarium]RSL33102.1 1-phosphofructokinase [Salibacterium salarium]